MIQNCVLPCRLKRDKEYDCKFYCYASSSREAKACRATTVFRSYISSDDVRRVKAKGMDLKILFVDRFMPVIFALLTSSEIICDLFFPQAFATRVERDLVCHVTGY